MVKKNVDLHTLVKYDVLNLNMQNDDFLNLAKMDWTEHNRQAIKRCKEQADSAAIEHNDKTENPLLDSPHYSVQVGVDRWAFLNKILYDSVVTSHLFEGITAHWIDFNGAPILELRGKYTSLTAKHVLTRDEKISDSPNGYRQNKRANNQKNLELFKEAEVPTSSEDLIHIVLQHGGQGDNFAFFRVYLEDGDVPDLFGNIMDMPSLKTAPEEEFVLKPVPTLKPTAVPAKEISTHETVDKTENDHSQS